MTKEETRTEKIMEEKEVVVEKTVITEAPACTTDLTLAFLVLRGWLAVRAILTGIEKFSAFKIIQKPFVDPTTGMEDPSGALVEVKQKFYSFTNYSGVPQSLKDKFASEPM